MLWYEARGPVHVLGPSGPRSIPRQKATRKAVFEVEARTLDTARVQARDYVRRRGGELLSVNFTTRPNELIVYTKEKS